MTDFGTWSTDPAKLKPYSAPAKKSKVSGRGGTPTSLISEGGALAGAIGGGLIAGPLGALVGGAVAGFGGRLAENKVRDDRWGTWDALKEGGMNAIPLGGGFVRPVGKATELMATHSLYERNLKKLATFGGSPQPSIGIVNPEKHAISDFGEITLIGNNKLVDPQLPGNSTFTSDIYSPRHPDASYRIPDKARKSLRRHLKSGMKPYKKYRDTPLNDSLDDVEDAYVVHSILKRPDTMAQYLESKGITPNVPTGKQLPRDKARDLFYSAKIKENGLEKQFKEWTADPVNAHYVADREPYEVKYTFLRRNDIWEEHHDKRNNTQRFDFQIDEAGLRQDYQNYIKNLIDSHGGGEMLKLETASGKTRYIPNTPENALELMRAKKLRGGEGGLSPHGTAAIRALIAPKLKSIDDIVANKDRLIDSKTMAYKGDEISTFKQNVYNQLSNYRKKDENGNTYPYEESHNAILDYLKGKPAALKEKYENVPDYVMHDLKQLRTRMKKAPTEYFESVPDRVVKLNEFEAAVIPRNISPEAREILRKNKMKLHEYDEGFSGNGGGRQDVLKDIMLDDNMKRFPDKYSQPKSLEDAILDAKRFTDANSFREAITPDRRVRLGYTPAGEMFQGHQHPNTAIISRFNENNAKNLAPAILATLLRDKPKNVAFGNGFFKDGKGQKAIQSLIDQGVLIPKKVSSRPKKIPSSMLGTTTYKNNASATKIFKQAKAKPVHTHQSPLMEAALNSKSYEEFSKKVMASYEKYRNELNDLTFASNSAQMAHSNPRQQIWEQARRLKESSDNFGSVTSVKGFRSGGDAYKENGTELVARERFNIPALKKISSGGSDRDVYDLGDGHVLKVSKTARGLAQNKAETDKYAHHAGLIPKSVEAGKNYVVTVKVNKPDANTRQMVKEMNSVYRDFENKPYAERDTDILKTEVIDVMNKHNYAGDDLWRYDYMEMDMRDLDNWGTTLEGKPIHLDGGTLKQSILDDTRYHQKYAPDENGVMDFADSSLDDPDFNKVYHKSKAAKKKYGDLDKATMYGIAGLLGGGAVVSGAQDKKPKDNFGSWSSS